MDQTINKLNLFSSRGLILFASLLLSPQLMAQTPTVGTPSGSTAQPIAPTQPIQVGRGSAGNGMTQTINAGNAAGNSAAATAGLNGMQNAAGASHGGSGLAIVGEVITGGVGIYMASMCGPHNAMACVMAAQCAMQLIQTASAQNGADNVNGAYNPDFGYGTGGNYGTGDPGGGGSATDPNGNNNNNNGGKGPGGGATTTVGADLSKIQGSLAAAGVAIDSATGAITLPNGKTVPANSTPGSMKASGFDVANIDKMVGDEKALESKLLAKAGANASGIGFGYSGGGGGRATAGAANPNASMDLNSLLNSRLNGNGRGAGSGKASVAGLSKKLGNENIGVKGDNIFEMVNRRYRSQDQQNAFLREK